MAYDMLGNYITDIYDDEEEKKKREAQAAPVKPTPVKETIVTDPTTGEKTITITGTEKDLSAANANTPTVVKPDELAAYRKQVGFQESGNKPDIGYHDKTKSSAFGTYGITAPAYKDIQAANPKFANRDITTLTGPEQDEAMNTYTGLNRDRLKAQGVEPTDANMRLAHFLGPTGAKNYLSGGSISPAAAAANGGEARVQQLADARLRGPAVPGQATTSNGVQVAGGTTASDAYPTTNEAAVSQLTKKDYTAELNAAQKDPKLGLAIASDANAPQWARDQAATLYANSLRVNDTYQKEKNRITTDLASGDPKKVMDIGKAFAKTSDEGSYVKAILYDALGLNEMAQAEQKKLLGTYGEWGNQTLASGEQAAVQYNPSGKPISGYAVDKDGNARQLTDKDLGQLSLTNRPSKNVTTSAEVILELDKNGKVIGRYREQADERGNTALRNTITGETFKGDPSTLQRERDVAAITKMDYGVMSDLRKKHGNNVLDAEKDYVTLNGPFKSAADRQNFREAYGFGAGMPGGAAPTQGGATPPPTPSTGGAPTTTTGGAPTGATTTTPPGPYRGAVKDPNVSAPIAQQQQNYKVTEAERKDFIERQKPEITKAAMDGIDVSKIRKEQTAIILKNPELAGLMNGQGSAGKEVVNIVRDAVAGKFESVDDLSTRISNLDLNQQQKAALYEYIGLQQQILPKTLKSVAGSGAISAPEHAMNAKANVDATKVPLYSGLTLISRNQFDHEMNSYRLDFAEATGASTGAGEARAWAAEKRKLTDAYNNIYQARANYIKEHGETAAATVAAFKLYPAPSWNPDTREWEYGGESGKVARPSLDKFNK